MILSCIKIFVLFPHLFPLFIWCQRQNQNKKHEKWFWVHQDLMVWQKDSHGTTLVYYKDRKDMLRATLWDQPIPGFLISYCNFFKKLDMGWPYRVAPCVFINWLFVAGLPPLSCYCCFSMILFCFGFLWLRHQLHSQIAFQLEWQSQSLLLTLLRKEKGSVGLWLSSLWMSNSWLTRQAGKESGTDTVECRVATLSVSHAMYQERGFMQSR